MSVVYFIECAGRIKIGITQNLKARVSALQTSAPGKLTVIATVPGAAKLERELHGQLHAHRITGEWFTDCEEVRDAIHATVNKHGGIFDPDISVQVRPLPAPPPEIISNEPAEWDAVGRLVAGRRAAVEHFGGLVDSPVIQDMQRAHELECKLRVEPGSIIKKIYQCENPTKLHLQTLKRLDRLFAKSEAVGDRIVLAIIKQDLSASEGLARANEVLIELADAALASLRAVHRPIVNNVGN